jgi:hypothetical protein
MGWHYTNCAICRVLLPVFLTPKVKVKLKVKSKILYNYHTDLKMFGNLCWTSLSTCADLFMTPSLVRSLRRSCIYIHLHTNFLKYFFAIICWMYIMYYIYLSVLTVSPVPNKFSFDLKIKFLIL